MAVPSSRKKCQNLAVEFVRDSDGHLLCVDSETKKDLRWRHLKLFKLVQSNRHWAERGARMPHDSEDTFKAQGQGLRHVGSHFGQEIIVHVDIVLGW